MHATWYSTAPILPLYTEGSRDKVCEGGYILHHARLDFNLPENATILHLLHAMELHLIQAEGDGSSKSSDHSCPPVITSSP